MPQLTLEKRVAALEKQIAELNQFTVDRLNQPIQMPMWLPVPSHLRERRAPTSFQ